MKKVIYLLMLCLVLILGACGKYSGNGEPVAKSTSQQVKGGNNSNTEQNIQATDNRENHKCVMVDGVIYKDTGYISSMAGCGTMDGEIISTVTRAELPTQNNQSNFGSGYQYQRSMDGTLVVVIDDERIIFRDIKKDDKAMPTEVISFNGRVKEVTGADGLVVTHISTAEGFHMNNGDYYVSAKNLAQDIHAGDNVTIWFNGKVQETYPAKLGVVYKILKNNN